MRKKQGAATAASSNNRKSRRAQAALLSKENPEGLSEAPNNTLFGRKAVTGAKRSNQVEEINQVPKKQKGKHRAEVPRGDPAAAPRSSSSDGRAKARTPERASDSSSAKSARPHADVVERSTKIWERLRTDKTDDAERKQLIDEVLKLFRGKIFEVLQKHDAARVIQSCFKQGESSQRDNLMLDLKGQLYQLARSHYGHFLLLCIVRHGSTAHKQQIMAEVKGHVAELLVHAEGSTVLQLLYTDVANAQQKHMMYRELWGIEFGLLLSGSTNERDSEVTTLKGLFESDPLARPRVLKRMEILLSKAARKGLTMTTLVQRGMAELIEVGEREQRAELVSVMRDSAVHIMHTRDGARIACGCLRHGDAKDRKVLLKALKGFVSRAAQDTHGALVVCTALGMVDDTVLLAKSLLIEMQEELLQLALHPHGSLSLLQVLAPRSTRYFNADQLAVIGEADSSVSKKDPEQRRRELLVHLLPALCELCRADPVTLACSPHGSAIIFETANAACESDVSEGKGHHQMMEALAANATKAIEQSAPQTLLTHPIAARLLKRLVQKHQSFATGLLEQLRGNLLTWVEKGSAWVVLALLESPSTAKRVRKELSSSVAQIGKCDAAGCPEQKMTPLSMFDLVASRDIYELEEIILAKHVKVQFQEYQAQPRVFRAQKERKIFLSAIHERHKNITTTAPHVVDPFLAVKEEVEHSVDVVVDLHKKWLDLSAAATHGDEFEWTSSELLSGLRSIEWDLQDLEDTVNIVESNKQKFQLDEAELHARKDFIEGTRQQVAQMREEVQSFVAGESAPTGCATAKGSAIMGALQGKGYGSVATGDEDVSTDLEMNGKLHQGGAPSATEDILEMDKLGMPP
ncbi:MAG: hypothetical protein SGPRY_001085, partial [Prymnesium sp.]